MIKHEIEIGGRILRLETGKVARQSDGAVVTTYGDTVVLTAVNAADEPREGIDFFPLQVEYRERHYAGGKIPGGFFKREARPSEREVLTCRLTDRPIRPLFPKNFKCETQIIITALSSDNENPADILAGIGASTALMISDIPWHGPIATVRVGKIGADYLVFPTHEQIEKSDFELVVSGNENTIVMVEGEAQFITESELVEALKFAHENIQKIIELQNQLVKDVTVTKREILEAETDPELDKAVTKLVKKEISRIIKIADKMERENSTSDLYARAQESLAEDFPESESEIKSIISDHFKQAFREMILSKGTRVDGRTTTEIRPITIDPGFLPRTHGSALFTRGETQALVVTTLGSKRDEQIIDSMDDDYTKNFMLHYNFPPYSVGEVGRFGFTSRREIGHGHLAERALKQVLPSREDFPYTVRLVSEILESNGSSSMATVCGASLALMNSGVPISRHVAGIAMGLILDNDDDRYAILSDILGAEDHLGDMDFKVAGAREGITAIQLDLKIEGISFELLTEALEQAKKGRMHILELMEKAIPEPGDISEYAPKILSLQINPLKIGELIGPGGKNIKKIIAETECDINVDDDGIVTISNSDLKKCQAAVDLVRAITMEPEVGQEFEGKITRILDFGAFVEFVPGREGLIHISELDWGHTKRVQDVVNIGDSIKVKLIRVDDQGRYDFSRRALMPKPEGYTPPPPRDRDRNRGRDRNKNRSSNRPFKKKRY